MICAAARAGRPAEPARKKTLTPGLFRSTGRGREALESGSMPHRRVDQNLLSSMWMTASGIPARGDTRDGGAAKFGIAGRSGFTLTEVLVVMGMVVVLIAILLPTVARVRNAARQATCMSQVRQLGLAYTAYLGESAQQGFGFNFTPQSSWATVLRSRLSAPDQLYVCPSAGEDANDFGSATSSWTLVLKPDTGAVTVTGSYGFNGWLLAWDPKNKGGDRFSGGTAADHVRVLGGNPALVPMFADCTWLDAWPRASDPTPPNLRDGDRRRQGQRFAPHENMMARFTIARHGKSINVIFVDGHAESVPLDGLKRLQWSSQFVYQDWDPPLPTR
jgi:prepilin-type N-terminal cleavage/methylation domain-containing protein/prepilin-type processing-associated H-X9-DG protein